MTEFKHRIYRWLCVLNVWPKFKNVCFSFQMLWGKGSFMSVFGTKRRGLIIELNKTGTLAYNQLKPNFMKSMQSMLDVSNISTVIGKLFTIIALNFFVVQRNETSYFPYFTCA